MVFVVALSRAAFKEGGDYTWIDVVEKRSYLEHPSLVHYRYSAFGLLQNHQ